MVQHGALPASGTWPAVYSLPADLSPTRLSGAWAARCCLSQPTEGWATASYGDGGQIARCFPVMILCARRSVITRWVLVLTAVLFVATQAVAQQQPPAGMIPPPGEIPQIVAFDNEGLLGDHIHIFGDVVDLGKWGNSISSIRLVSPMKR